MTNLISVSALVVLSCASVQSTVAGPSSLPSEYILVKTGYVATEPGFFINIPGAVNELTMDAEKTIESEKQIKILTIERDSAVGKLESETFCSKYCLWFGLIGGLAIGALSGWSIESAVHR